MQISEKAELFQSWLEEKNIKDVEIIDISNIATDMDAFIIGTASSDRNAKSVADFIEEKAEEILQKEILENIIKSNIRVEKKFSEDIKENEKYLLRIDSKEQEDVYDEDIDGEWEEIQYTHNISHLIKLKEPVKNDIHKSIHPYMSKTELEKE